MIPMYEAAWNHVASMKRHWNPLSAGTPSPLRTPRTKGQLLAFGFVGLVMLSNATTR